MRNTSNVHVVNVNEEGETIGAHWRVDFSDGDGNELFSVTLNEYERNSPQHMLGRLNAEINEAGYSTLTVAEWEAIQENEWSQETETIVWGDPIVHDTPDGLMPNGPTSE
jgi:hypothetical protein